VPTLLLRPERLQAPLRTWGAPQGQGKSCVWVVTEVRASRAANVLLLRAGTSSSLSAAPCPPAPSGVPAGSRSGHASPGVPIAVRKQRLMHLLTSQGSFPAHSQGFRLLVWTGQLPRKIL
jgi:hypothetical protein